MTVDAADSLPSINIGVALENLVGPNLKPDDFLPIYYRGTEQDTGQ